MKMSKMRTGQIIALILGLCTTSINAEITCEYSEFGQNEIAPGGCGCNGQLFVNDDCTEMFYCSDEVPQGQPDAEGCALSCPAEDGLRVQVDLVNREWNCTERESNYVCPGKLQTYCDNTVETMCECINQIWISDDCHTGFWCSDEYDTENAVNPGNSIRCPPGQIISISFDFPPRYFCVEDVNQCPGPFHFGCDGGDFGNLTTLAPTYSSTTEEPFVAPEECIFETNEIVQDGCECNGQLFVNNDCTEMFYCSDEVPQGQPDAEGCALSCPAEDGLRVQVDLINREWNCTERESNYVCPGKLQTYCDTTVETICECQNQIWISDDCNEGFWCSDAYDQENAVNPGNRIRCPPGQIISISFDFPPRYFCVEDVNQCPGSFHFGCEREEIDPTTIEPISTTEDPFTSPEGCIFDTNEIVQGGCECNGQLFVNDDCTKMFYCFDDVPQDQLDAEGCALSCPAEDGLRVQVDLVNKEWNCAERDSNYVCPGKLQTYCDTTVETMCECVNQIWINDDCSEGFWCSDEYDTENAVNPGNSIRCPPGQIISISFDFPPRYFCVEDVNQCPGSFHFGCDGGDFGNLTTLAPTYSSTTEEPFVAPEDCIFETNEIVQDGCECNGQLFVNNDCTEMFYCSDEVPQGQPDAEGCALSCPAEDGLRVQVDLINREWNCTERESNYVCPGKLQTYCDATVDTICECQNQIWISDDCNEGFWCSDEYDTENDVNPGSRIRCPPGQIISISFDFPPRYSCVENVNQCPGSFHFGCDGGDFGNLTTPTPLITTTEDPMTQKCDYNINEIVLGGCGCDEQIFVNEDCTEMFYCKDDIPVDEIDAEGCALSCPAEDNLRVEVDLLNNSWDCVEREPDFVCTGKLQTDCSVNYDIDCECKNQIWINGFCHVGFVCSETAGEDGINNGTDIRCPLGQIISPSFVFPPTYECVADDGQCPGSLHFGCDGGDFSNLTTLNPITTTEDPLNPTCDYDINPIGSCECDEQIFVNENCTQMFYCQDNIPAVQLEAEGCVLNCPAEDGLRVQIDLVNKEWHCVEREEGYICPGKLETDCEDNIDVICECKNQIWMGEDCLEAYFCADVYDSENDVNPGNSITCPPGTIISFDFVYPPRYQCVNNEGQCPGSFHFGCQGGDFGNLTTLYPFTTTEDPIMEECNYDINEIGTCACDEQIFVNEDCTEMFYCQNDIPADHIGAEGCALNCPTEDGLRVHVDLVNNDWNCVDRETDYVCPGKLETDCDDNFDVICECAQQIWINADCSEGYYCDDVYDNENDENPGRDFSCPPGQIIFISFFYPPRYQCVNDEGQCPGSFHFGCQGGDFGNLTTLYPYTTTEDPTTDVCDYDINEIGSCECDEQIFVNEDCTEMFYCQDDIPADHTGADGCALSCPAEDGLRVEIDLINNEWNCIDREEGYICPGKLETDCDDNFDVICECKNQIWMSEDCLDAYFCADVYDSENDVNPGNSITCPPGTIISFDFVYPPRYQCVNNEGQCPGSFHFGCQGGDFGNLTTLYPFTTTTAEPITTTEQPMPTTYWDITTEPTIPTTDVATTPEEPQTTTAILTTTVVESTDPPTSTAYPMMSSSETPETTTMYVAPAAAPPVRTLSISLAFLVTVLSLIWC